MMSGLITFVIIYVIGAFLTALGIGFFRPYMDDDLALLIYSLWPLTLMVIGAKTIGDAIEGWANQNPNIAHRIDSILDHITILFRPITLGRKIREWLDDSTKDSVTNTKEDP